MSPQNKKITIIHLFNTLIIIDHKRYTVSVPANKESVVRAGVESPHCPDWLYAEWRSHLLSALFALAARIGIPLRDLKNSQGAYTARLLYKFTTLMDLMDKFKNKQIWDL